GGGGGGGGARGGGGAGGGVARGGGAGVRPRHCRGDLTFAVEVRQPGPRLALGRERDRVDDRGPDRGSRHRSGLGGNGAPARPRASTQKSGARGPPASGRRPPGVERAED